MINLFGKSVMQNPGHAWYHWAIAAVVVVAAVAAVVFTAGGAAPALMAAAAIVNGSVAAAATAPTVALVAAGVAIGGGMALATSAMDAEQSSTSLEDFWDYEGTGEVTGRGDVIHGCNTNTMCHMFQTKLLKLWFFGASGNNLSYSRWFAGSLSS